MKVLAVAPYRDFTGWGWNAIETILALDAAGVDVVPRCIKFSQHTGVLPGRLLELEARDPRGCDVVIQNSLPHTFEPDGRFARNVGSYFVETSNFASSEWPRRINAMDRAWVPCRANRAASLASGVTIPVDVIPCPADTDKYLRHHEPLKLRDDLGDAFVFYTVGESIRRKNLVGLVQAFHLEFDPAEPVELVIQTHVKGLTPAEARADVRKKFAEIRRGLNLYADDAHYKPERIVTEYLDAPTMMRLHNSCDCFVSPSYGEGWGIPAFDAMAFGKTPIVTAWGAVLDFVDDANGWLIPGTMQPVLGMQDVHGDLYTGHQDWCSVDLNALRRAMRQAYADRGLREAKADAGVLRALDFARDKVGRLMKENLER